MTSGTNEDDREFPQESLLRAMHDVVCEATEKELDELITDQGGSPEVYAAASQEAVRQVVANQREQCSADMQHGLDRLRKALASRMGTRRYEKVRPVLGQAALARLAKAFEQTRPDFTNALIQYASRTNEDRPQEEDDILDQFADYLDSSLTDSVQDTGSPGEEGGR